MSLFFNLVRHLETVMRLYNGKRESFEICFALEFGTCNVSFRLFETGAHVSDGSIPPYKGCKGCRKAVVVITFLRRQKVSSTINPIMT